MTSPLLALHRECLDEWAKAQEAFARAVAEGRDPTEEAQAMGRAGSITCLIGQALEAEIEERNRA